MSDVLVRKFDLIVLRPISIALIVSGIAFLVRAEWVVGGLLLVIAVFGVGAVGSSLHRKKSFGELAAGYPHLSALDEATPKAIQRETSLQLSRAGCALGVVLALVTILLSIRFGLRWYWAAAIAIATVWLTPMLVVAPFVWFVRPRK